MRDYWLDQLQGMELEREISQWCGNYMPKGEWKVVSGPCGVKIPQCTRCFSYDPHMRPICWNCGSLMKQLIKNNKGEYEYKYPDRKYLEEFYND